MLFPQSESGSAGAQQPLTISKDKKGEVLKWLEMFVLFFFLFSLGWLTLNGHRLSKLLTAVKLISYCFFKVVSNMVYKTATHFYNGQWGSMI